jgi:hypothetical protein
VLLVGKNVKSKVYSGHTMKAKRGSWGVVHSLWTTAVDSPESGRFTRVKEPWFPLNERLDRYQNRVGRFGGDIIFPTGTRTPVSYLCSNLFVCGTPRFYKSGSGDWEIKLSRMCHCYIQVRLHWSTKFNFFFCPTNFNMRT